MIDVRGLHHVGLAVADLSASCDFYCGCGYSVADRLHLHGSDPAIGNGLAPTGTETIGLEIAFLSSPGVTLELLQFDPPGRALSIDDPCFGSVPVTSAPDRATTDRATTDPDGHPVSVSRTSDVAVTLTTSVPRETARLLRLLGFEPETDTVLVGHGARLELSAVSGAVPVPTADCPGRMHVCCQVDDMDSAVSAVVAEGFSMVSTPRVSGNLQWVFVRHDGGPGIELLSVSE